MKTASARCISPCTSDMTEDESGSSGVQPNVEMRDSEKDIAYGSHAHFSRGNLNGRNTNRAGKPKISRRLVLHRISRVVVTLVCLGFFIYYLTIFFQMYGEYPTVVDVNVDFPDSPDMPAVTICNHNVLRKKELHEADQKAWAELRDNPKNFSQILRKTLATLPLPKILELAMPASEVFISFQIANFQNKMRNVDVNTSELAWIYFEKRVCYAINVEWAIRKQKQIDFNETDSELVMVLDLKPDSTFNPNHTMAEIFIHSPIGLPDSRTSHFPASGGKSYDVGIQKTTIALMEPPYQTMCTNYSKLLAVSNDTDNISKKVCYTRCMAEMAVKACNCIPECMLFMESYMTKMNFNACITDATEQELCCETAMSLRKPCQKKCPMECNIRLYDIQADANEGIYIFEDEIRRKEKDSEYEDKRYAEIRINLQLVRHTVYTHNPKITPVEILGYVGGYLGIWLGVSIPLLYDQLLILLDGSQQVICGKKKLSEVVHVHSGSRVTAETPSMPTSQQLYGQKTMKSQLFPRRSEAKKKWAQAVDYIQRLAFPLLDIPYYDTKEYVPALKHRRNTSYSAVVIRDC